MLGQRGVMASFLRFASWEEGTKIKTASPLAGIYSIFVLLISRRSKLEGCYLWATLRYPLVLLVGYTRLVLSVTCKQHELPAQGFDRIEKNILRTYPRVIPSGLSFLGRPPVSREGRHDFGICTSA